MAVSRDIFFHAVISPQEKNIFVIAGFAVVAILVRQWTRRPRGVAEPVAVDPAMSERIRREVERGS